MIARTSKSRMLPLMVMCMLFVFGWFVNGSERKTMVYVCLGGGLVAVILASYCGTKPTYQSNTKAKMTPPASKSRKENRSRSISRDDLEKNSSRTVLGTMLEMNRNIKKKIVPSNVLKFSRSVDLEVENFTKRLMKSQSESPDTKIKLKLPKGAFEKMKRFSLRSDDDVS
jgi:hypothetical protein